MANASEQRSRRSILMGSGADERGLVACRDAKPDVLLIDLEDSVASAAKPEARARTIRLLGDALFEGSERWVRINPISSIDGFRDLLSLPAGRPDALMPTKVESAEEIVAADYILRRQEEELGFASGAIRLCPMIETGLAVLHLEEIISASDRVSGILLGSEDLSVDVGFTRTESGEELSWVRNKMVLTAHSLGIECFDVASMRLNNPEALFAESKRSCAMGFDGKGCIAPQQVEIVHRGFTPEPERVEWATRILEAERHATANGLSEFVVDGKLVYLPLIRQAINVLRRAGIKS